MVTLPCTATLANVNDFRAVLISQIGRESGAMTSVAHIYRYLHRSHAKIVATLG